MAKYERVNLRVIASPSSYINLGFNITSPITGNTGWTVNYKSGFTATASIADISGRFYPEASVDWIDHPEVVKDGNRNGSTTDWAIIEIGNLDDTKTYRFDVFCSSTDLLYETEVVVGDESAQIITPGLMQDNGSTALTFSGVSPTSGIIELKYKRPVGSAYANAIINAFRVLEEDHPDVVVETYTVAPSGGDYTSLAAFQTAQVQNLVANNKRIEVTVSGDLSGSFNMSSSWATDPDHYVLFKAASGSEAIDFCSISGGDLTVGAGAARLTSSNLLGTSFIFSADYTRVKDLYFSNTNSSGYASVYASGYNSLLENCIAITPTNSTSGNVRGMRVSGGRLYKCISAMTGSTDEPAIEATGAYSRILNCLAHGSPIGISGYSSSVNLERTVIQNSVAYACTTDYEFTNTAESDATLPVAFVGSRNNAGATSTAANIPGTDSVVSITASDFETDSVLGKPGEKLDNTGYAHLEFILDVLGNPIVGGWPIGVNDPISATEITSSGGFSGGVASVSGAAVRNIVSSAVLTSLASSAAGIANREITTSSTLLSDASSLSGTASVGAETTSSGALSSGTATLSATAVRDIISQATLSAQPSSLSGVVDRILFASGNYSNADAYLSSTASRVVTSTSVLASDSATITGTSARNVVVSSSTITSSDASLTGALTRELTTSGVLLSSNSTLSGVSTLSGSFVASGSLASTPATMTGAVTKAVLVSATLDSTDSSVSAVAVRELTSQAALVSDEAALISQSVRNLVAQAFLQTDDATLVGFAADSLNIALTASFGLVSGTVTIERKVSAALAAQFSTISGEATTAVTVLARPVQLYTAEAVVGRFESDLTNKFIASPLAQRKFNTTLTNKFDSGSYQRLFSAI